LPTNNDAAVAGRGEIMNSRRTLTLFAALVLAATLVACGGSSGSPTAPTPPSPPPQPPASDADLVITIVGMAGSQSFSPNPGVLRAGLKVAWFNADTMAHTATANSGAFDTGFIAPGAISASITISTAGTYAYFCTLHPTMVGTLSVTQ
jgi:plastocyanin